ncbi:MAG: hypothetical protein CVT67_11225 [Actinobacteria bacterium HGW-Actinobacteria-7]|jgi:hypothetical protein|nr:MAG: hypothetical protein CVT67_11225 [Actinobacteria bacterium HGW-Actinobacteria-7]
MAPRHRARPGRLLAIGLAGVAFCVTLGAAAAFAADVPEQPSFEQLFQQLQNSPVYKDACTKTCHGSIAKTENYASAIKFQHGYHQLVACDSCHPRFPHRADTTIERPSMKGCFDCHGVRHGPMGVIASGECVDCHVTPRERLRPAFHTFGWAGVEHVAPANKEFNTKCAMCHQPASCNECHDREGIKWAPASWDYDAGDGCLACHGEAGLTKQSAAGMKSFQVTGLTDSAHTDLSCQDCHQDYRYDDKTMPSQLWTVNAGQACASCHSAQKDNKNLSEADRTRLSAPVAAYNQSKHAEAISQGNYDAATCGSCHGGHFIARTDNDAAKQRLHMSSYRVCARCKQHGTNYDTYDDYYHGKAYKAGAADAPACWDCHGSHKILPAASKESSVNAANVGATCGRPGCHSGSSEKFGAAAADLIHTKVAEQEANPLRKLIAKLTGK